MVKSTIVDTKMSNEDPPSGWVVTELWGVAHMHDQLYDVTCWNSDPRFKHYNEPTPITGMKEFYDTRDLHRGPSA